MAQCTGVKKNGEKCTTLVIGDVRRCGTHRKTLENTGPNQIRRDELKYVHNRELNLLYPLFQEIRNNPEELRVQLLAAYNAAVRQENIRFQTELHVLENTITQETIENGGVDADRIARGRRQDRQIIRNQQAAARNARFREQWRERQRVRIIPPLNVVAVAHNDLANLANDRQNVHTEVVVNRVKETIIKVLLINVPDEYQTDTLKTPGEIILECKLSKVAAWQMMSKYCAEEDIYELGVGVYARVLNAVWQYIKSSPDAPDLKRILALEMQDNIGMCAQGNLSRICNILSGYMEGLDMRSKNEILGERIAALMDVENMEDRATQAQAILQELEVPGVEWHVWMEPLFA